MLCSGSCGPGPRPISSELGRGKSDPRPQQPCPGGWPQACSERGPQPSLHLPTCAGCPGALQRDYSAHGKPGPGRAALTVHPACGSFPCGALASPPHCCGPASVYLEQAAVPRACTHRGGGRAGGPLAAQHDVGKHERGNAQVPLPGASKWIQPRGVVARLPQYGDRLPAPVPWVAPCSWACGDLPPPPAAPLWCPFPAVLRLPHLHRAAPWPLCLGPAGGASSWRPSPGAARPSRCPDSSPESCTRPWGPLAQSD